MAFRLTPRDDRLIPLITALAQVALDATAQLAQLFGAEPSGREAAAGELTRIEQRGDDATHTLIAALTSSFITPFDREDLHTLALALDDCVDRLDDSGQLLMTYRLVGLPHGAAELLNAVTRMSQLTVEAMGHLSTPVRLSRYRIEVSRLENHATRIHRRAVAEVYGSGNDVLAMLKVRELLDEMLAAARSFESVAAVVERILVKGA